MPDIGCTVQIQYRVRLYPPYDALEILASYADSQ